MFRRRKKTHQYWENREYMAVRTIGQMHELNESQRRLHMIGPREYNKQVDDIEKEIEQMEANYSIFDERMGHPMKELDRLFDIGQEKADGSDK